jgi:hypothetical protein
VTPTVYIFMLFSQPNCSCRPRRVCEDAAFLGEVHDVRVALGGHAPDAGRSCELRLPNSRRSIFGWRGPNSVICSPPDLLNISG